MIAKKLTTALTSVVLAAAMTANMAISVSATEVKDANNTVVGDCSFYRLKNDEWSAAPYGMDDGNITSAVLNSDGTITLYFDFAEYKVMGFLPVTGGIDDVSGEGVVEKGGDDDNDNCLDWVTVTPDKTISITICTTDGDTDIAYGLMSNPITAKLVYVAE